MADRDPFILRRLAECRIDGLFTDAARRRRPVAPVIGWRRTAGTALVRLGQAVLGDERGKQTPPLLSTGAVR
jgi:hypothetical protein